MGKKPRRDSDFEIQGTVRRDSVGFRKLEMVEDLFGVAARRRWARGVIRFSLPPRPVGGEGGILFCHAWALNMFHTWAIG